MGVVPNDQKNKFQRRKLSPFPRSRKVAHPEGRKPPKTRKQPTPQWPVRTELSPRPGCSLAKTRSGEGAGGRRTRATLSPDNRPPTTEGRSPGAAETHPPPGRAGTPQPPAQPAAQAQARPQRPPHSPTHRPFSSGTPSRLGGRRKAQKTTLIPSPPARHRQTPGIYLSPPHTGRRFYAPFATAGKEGGRERRGARGAGPDGEGRGGARPARGQRGSG